MSRFNSVNIRPGVNVLSVLPHLNYKAWYALAEFVDNSIQSSISRFKDLETISGGNYVLRVDISFKSDDSRIVILDNAAGISSSDYQRAFRPAEIPPDASGLSEFGMGMKSAACWFAPKWSARSSALGESIERTVHFDINRIVHDSIEELDVIHLNVSKDKHYTEIRLEDIRRFPKGRTIRKIKDHLSSIYRIFLRKGKLELIVDNQKLSYEEPKILVAPYHNTNNMPEGSEIIWKRELNIDLGENKLATGFVAIREIASTRLAGFALFRRDRLVLGSYDETYRPHEIFGHSNSFAYQRIFGEIHLKGFNVSHTKDGVKWEECEDEFLNKLQQKLTSDEMPIHFQVKNYRTKKDVYNARQSAAEAGHNVVKRFNHKAIVSGEIVKPIQPSDSEPEPELSNDTIEVSKQIESLSDGELDEFQFECNFQDDPWVVKIELAYGDSNRDWLFIENRPSIQDPDPREVLIRINMLHPFMVQFTNPDSDGFSAVLYIAASLALSEVIATESYSPHPKAVLQNTNVILKSLTTRTIRDE